MSVKEVLLVLTDGWADWEAAYAAAGINSAPGYAVKTIAADVSPKASIGGLRAEVDYVIGEYAGLDNAAMLILPGGYGWKKSRHDDIAAFVRQAADRGIPVAAICGAAIFLGKHGFLDNVKHTGDELEFFLNEEGYNGRESYVSAQTAVDRGFITANETAAVDFAREIFGALGIDSEEGIARWHDLFKNGMVR